ncbi:ABC transporter permease [Paenibacillus hexagrammi]|uniref:ABC transporter permease n=1 Tax=Paenibacillus hexagrammi TaxID=2908839 RepID=A0ABY3SKC9_9BACL|nr:ABC transporter permease [Paenibacillus sp. YPD9-1]UJF34159.1 ABC transporter permease [Paenibacillus sp. YPD9-1]
MNSMLTVIRFTFMSRFRSKTFKVMCIVIILLLSVMIHLPALIDKLSSHDASRIGVFAGQQQAVAQKLADYYNKQEGSDIAIDILPDAGSPEANDKTGKQQIAEKRIKGYLEFAGGEAGSFPTAVYKSEGSMEFNLKSKLQAALQLIKTDVILNGVGLTDAQKASIQAPATLETMQISTTDQAAAGKSESQMLMAYALVYVLLFMLYMGVIAFGNMVATEITSEKSSRVMELLITSVSPLKQMFGKIIGICLLALLQITLTILTAVVNLALSSNGELIQELHLNWSDLQVSLLVYFFIFYLLGFFIYATVFAAVGSLVSRTEEVGQAIMPVTFLIIAAFMVAMYGLNNPNASFVAVMSFVPFFSPLIMFLRIGMSSPASWEIGLSILIQAGSIIGMAWVAAKIYRTGVLMYGKRPSWRELRKAMRAYRV